MSPPASTQTLQTVEWSFLLWRNSDLREKNFIFYFSVLPQIDWHSDDPKVSAKSVIQKHQILSQLLNVL